MLEMLHFVQHDITSQFNLHLYYPRYEFSLKENFRQDGGKYVTYLTDDLF